MCSDLSNELEALRFTYYEDGQLTIQEPAAGIDQATNDDPVRITFKLVPDTNGDDCECYVSGMLQLTVTAGYPEICPNIKVENVKGLGDARQQELIQRLTDMAGSLVGNDMLLSIITEALEYMNSNNFPEGSCAFCLDSLVPENQGTNSVATAAKKLIKQPCYHSFHKSCYVTWWAWHQDQCWRKEEEMIKHTGANAVMGFAGEKLPQREQPPHDNMYQASCPTCRAACPLSSIPHLVPTLEKALQHGVHLNSTAQESSQHFSLNNSDIDAKTLTSMQTRHKRTFEKQQRAGGIIDPTAAVPMSITELESLGRSGSQLERSSSVSQVPVQTSSTQQAGQAQHQSRQQQRTPTTLHNSASDQHMSSHKRPGRGKSDRSDGSAGRGRSDMTRSETAMPDRGRGRGRHNSTPSHNGGNLCDGIAALQMTSVAGKEHNGNEGRQRSSARGRGRGYADTRRDAAE